MKLYLNEEEQKQFNILQQDIKLTLENKDKWLEQQLEEKSKFKVGDVVYAFNPDKLYRSKNKLGVVNSTQVGFDLWDIPDYTVIKVYLSPNDLLCEHVPRIHYEVKHSCFTYNTENISFYKEVGSLCKTKEEWKSKYKEHLERVQKSIEKDLQQLTQ